MTDRRIFGFGAVIRSLAVPIPAGCEHPDTESDACQEPKNDCDGKKPQCIAKLW